MKFLERDWKEKSYRFYVQKDKQALWIHYKGQIWLWKKQRTSQRKAKSKPKNPELIVSPLPGKIQKIFVKKNDTVKTGDELLLLSAMKIEYRFKAEAEGRIEDIYCSSGQIVEANKELIKIKYKKQNE